MKQAGFTLIELIIAMVVISIALTGTLMAINTIVRRSADPMIVQQAISIAESYLEEISSKAFPASLPCSGTAPTGGRGNYASICDYRFIAAAGEVPTDQLGVPISGVGSYTVKVNIDSSTASLQSLSATASQVIRIDVTVSHPQMTGMMFSVYRANY